ncbi:MAG: phosphoribosyl-ATP diphosphatase [Pseudomonadota bacterium]
MKTPPSFSLHDLEAIVARRAEADPDESYTARLIGEGVGACAQKLGEEAIETVIAAIDQDRDSLRDEVADLLFHLMVLLQSRNLPLDDVLEELARRTGQSGLAEKASRTIED